MKIVESEIGIGEEINL